MNNDKVYWECGTGWSALIRPLVQRCTDLGGQIDQIKEKFGRLRVYYTPMGPASETLWDQFEDEINEAERLSGNTCELCGKRGQMMIGGGQWYKTLCVEHGNELGYKVA